MSRRYPGIGLDERVEGSTEGDISQLQGENDERAWGLLAMSTILEIECCYD